MLEVADTLAPVSAWAATWITDAVCALRRRIIGVGVSGRAMMNLSSTTVFRLVV